MSGKKPVQNLSVLLLLAMLASTVSCGTSDTIEDIATDVTTTVATETLSELDARKAVDDELPEEDFEGRTFTMLTYDKLKADLYAESLNGEVINDAVYERNETVAERFNVNIETNSQTLYTDATAFIQKTVLAGDDSFQLAAHHVVAAGEMLMQDLFMNWYDIPYIDFSKPWWSPSTTEDLTYGDDKAILAVGDLALSSLTGTYCYFYDKTDAETYKLENLYDVVWE